MKFQIFKLNYNHLSSGFTLNKVSDSETNKMLLFDTKEEAVEWIASKQPIHNSYTILEMYHPTYD